MSRSLSQNFSPTKTFHDRSKKKRNLRFFDLLLRYFPVNDVTKGSKRCTSRSNVSSVGTVNIYKGKQTFLKINTDFLLRWWARVAVSHWMQVCLLHTSITSVPTYLSNPSTRGREPRPEGAPLATSSEPPFALTPPLVQFILASRSHSQHYSLSLLSNLSLSSSRCYRHAHTRARAHTRRFSLPSL